MCYHKNISSETIILTKSLYLCVYKPSLHRLIAYFMKLLIQLLFPIIMITLIYIANTEPKIAFSGIEKYANAVSDNDSAIITKQLSLENRYVDLIKFIDEQDKPSEEMTLLKGFTYQVQFEDDQRAFTEFAKIPNNGLAQFSLGHIYAKYADTNEEVEQALHWTKLAAKSGVVKAQHDLAIFYQQIESYENAYIWARCAKLNKLEKASALVSELSTTIFLKDKLKIDQTYTRAMCKNNKKYNQFLDSIGYKLS